MFLGLIGYYRKFIKNFSTIAKPLAQLLKKVVPFIWADEQEQVFLVPKDKLTNKPILQYPNFLKQLILTTDASNVGIGSVLSQLNRVLLPDT